MFTAYLLQLQQCVDSSRGKKLNSAGLRRSLERARQCVQYRRFKQVDYLLSLLFILSLFKTYTVPGHTTQRPVGLTPIGEQRTVDQNTEELKNEL